MLNGTFAEWAGNWRRIESFAWPDIWNRTRRDHWALAITTHRDADALTRTNAAAIAAEMKRFEARGIAVRESFGDWAHGWVEGWSFPGYTSKGRPTRVALAVQRIAERLESYPVLDEEAFSAAELDEWDEAFDFECPSLEWLTDKMREKVRSHLTRQYGYDMDGNYPSRERCREAMRALFHADGECEHCGGKCESDGGGTGVCRRCERRPLKMLRALAERIGANVGQLADGQWLAVRPDGTTCPPRIALGDAFSVALALRIAAHD